MQKNIQTLQQPSQIIASKKISIGHKKGGTFSAAFFMSNRLKIYLQLFVMAAAASGYFFAFASCKALQASNFLPVAM